MSMAGAEGENEAGHCGIGGSDVPDTLPQFSVEISPSMNHQFSSQTEGSDHADAQLGHCAEEFLDSTAATRH